MAFKLGAFARGFTSAAVTDKKETESEIKEIIKTSYIQQLEEAKELRKERKAKRQSLTEIGNQLKLLNLSDTQVAGILANGVSGAKNTLEQLQATAIAYGKAEKAFNVNDFVTASEESNLTIKDAVDRVMGTLKKPAGGAKLPGVAQQETFFGPTTKFAEGQVAQLEQGFGEEFGSLQAEVAGDYEYGELPTVGIDYAKMGVADPLLALQKRTAELDNQIKQIELDEAKKDKDAIAPLKSADAVKAQKQILGRISAAMQIDLKYDEDSGLVTSPTATAGQLSLARQLADQGMELMQAFGGAKDYTTAYAKTIDLLLGGLSVPPPPPPAGGRGTVIPSATAASGSATATTLPAYSSSQTPSAYVTSAANILNVSSLNPNDKAKAKAKIRNALIAGGQTAVDANKVISSIIK